jgi:hypothetical protein
MPGMALSIGGIRVVPAEKLSLLALTVFCAHHRARIRATDFHLSQPFLVGWG